MFSSRRCSFVVPGIGTIQGFWASSQASAICAGVAFFRFAMPPSNRPAPDSPFGIRREARHGIAEVGAVELRVFVRSYP